MLSCMYHFPPFEYCIYSSHCRAAKQSQPLFIAAQKLICFTEGWGGEYISCVLSCMYHFPLYLLQPLQFYWGMGGGYPQRLNVVCLLIIIKLPGVCCYCLQSSSYHQHWASLAGWPCSPCKGRRCCWEHTGSANVADWAGLLLKGGHLFLWIVELPSKEVAKLCASWGRWPFFTQ